MRKETAKKILSETEAGYDSIAQKFSQTRKHFWRGLEFLEDYVKPDYKVLDYGCGNGRLLELIGNEKIQYFGVDVSADLIKLAKEKYPNSHFAKIDPIQTTLTFETEYFNTIYSIAVFHHFPSKIYRQEIADELYRATKSGGHIIVTVWYLWQRKYFKNILDNWKNKLLWEILPPHQFFERLFKLPYFRKASWLLKIYEFKKDIWCGGLDWNDCMISFADNYGSKFFRFHHAFTKGELKKLFRQAGFEIEKCEIPDGRNIVLVGKKK